MEKLMGMQQNKSGDLFINTQQSVYPCTIEVADPRTLSIVQRLNFKVITLSR